jgi:hypothetical protein
MSSSQLFETPLIVPVGFHSVLSAIHSKPPEFLRAVVQHAYLGFIPPRWNVWTKNLLLNCSGITNLSPAHKLKDILPALKKKMRLQQLTIGDETEMFPIQFDQISPISQSADGGSGGPTAGTVGRI